MPVVSSIAALLFSVLALIAGNGLLNTLVPLRGKLEGFPDLAIGLLGSAYFAGMLAGTLMAPAMIRRAGYIRAFSALVALVIVLVLVFPYAVDPVVWVGLRYAIGFVFSGFYAVIEAWLTDKSDNSNRARVYALYQIATFAGTAGGQEVLAHVEPHSPVLFSIAAGFFALAILPMAFTRAEPPPRPRSVSLRLGWLWRTAPVSVLSALGIGCANGSFWALAPVYGLGLGLTPSQVAMFITAVILGTSLALYPIARLSDRGDRRRLLIILSTAGACAEVALAVASTLPFLVVAALAFAIGATSMVLYTLGVSHANDRAGADHGVTVSVGMLFLYCAGAIIAPVCASALMARYGSAALFWQNALVHLLLAGFAAVRVIAAQAPAGSPLSSPMPLDSADPGRTR